MTAELHQRLYQKYFGAEPSSVRPFDARTQISIVKRKNRIQDLLSIVDVIKTYPGISSKALGELMPGLGRISPYLRELREMGAIDYRSQNGRHGYWSMV